MTDTRPTGVYAMKGERITCENGHHIATLAEDMPFYHIGPPPLEDWQQREPPQIGELYPRCEICGGPFFDGTIPALCIEGKFRKAVIND